MQAACPIIVSRLEGGKHAFRNVIPVRKLVEPQFRDLERVPSRPMFSLSLALVLNDAIAIQSEQKDEVAAGAGPAR